MPKTKCVKDWYSHESMFGAATQKYIDLYKSYEQNAEDEMRLGKRLALP